MKTLKFIKDAVVDGDLVYRAGQTYKVSDETGSATRWLRRAVAVQVEEETVELPKVEVNTVLESPAQDLEVQELPVEMAMNEIEREAPTRLPRISKNKNKNRR